jgi:hypothetical protein
MKLTREEQAWLTGEAGNALKRAMEILVALGKIYGAKRLIPVASVQISGVSYRNLGSAGLNFLQGWAEEGAHVRVPTTLNPAAMDLIDWREQGFDPKFATKQQAVVEAFRRMGVDEGDPCPTCAPYLIGNEPEFGQHVAWAESSAVSYANSVLGARTNREGGPGAIAAALTGRTAAYGLHLEAPRRATLRVRVNVAVRTRSDYSALGAIVGKVARNRVPYFVGLPLQRSARYWEEKLKALGAAMAATGAVALYHVDEVTPEARAGPMLASETETVTIIDLAPGYAMLNDDVVEIDLVWFGCPHASLVEIAQIAERLRGQTLRVPLWITCARPVKDAARSLELAPTIEAAGGRLIADACMAIAPVTLALRPWRRRRPRPLSICETWLALRRGSGRWNSALTRPSADDGG